MGSRIISKYISALLILVFATGQAFAGDALAPTSASDKDLNPDRSDAVQKDVNKMWAEGFLSKAGVNFAHDKILKERLAKAFDDGSAVTIFGHGSMYKPQWEPLSKAQRFIEQALDNDIFVMNTAMEIAQTRPSKEGEEFHRLVTSIYRRHHSNVSDDIFELKKILLYDTRFVSLTGGDHLLNPYLYSIGNIASEEHRALVVHAGRFAYKGSEAIKGGPRSIYLTLNRILEYEKRGEKGMEAFRKLIYHELTDFARGHADESIPILSEVNSEIDAEYAANVVKVTQEEKRGAISVNTDKVSLEKYLMTSDLGTREVFAIKGSSKTHPDVPKGSRKVNVLCAKADVGSIGGHGSVYPAMLEAVADIWAKAAEEGKILDFFITRVGDDISITVTHINGKDNEIMHKLVWDSFINATVVSKDLGLYGAGQDLLKDSFSGNVKGAGPGITELEFVEREAEPIIILQADKCGPGVFNNAIAWIYTNPNSAYVALKPDQANKVKFGIVDFEYNKKAGREAILNPQEMNGLAFTQAISLVAGEQTRYSFTTLTKGEEDILGVTATRLHNIAGEYTGKDDPMLVVRTQKDLPAEGLITTPFFKLYKVIGWMMGSYIGYFLPVALTEAKIGVNDGPPLISAFGFNINNGRLVGFMDLFAANPAVKAVQMEVGSETMKLLSSTDLWTEGKGRAPAAETAYQKGIDKTDKTIPWVEGAKPSEKSTPILTTIKSGLNAKVNVYLEIPLKTAESLMMQNVIDEAAPIKKPIYCDEKTGFIFGERATFGQAINTGAGIEYEPGLGVMLSKFTRAGVKVAVIATTEKERNLIAELNVDNPPDNQIKVVTSLEEAKAALSTARFNYFKVKGDLEAAEEDKSITVYDVTNLVRRIIETLGHEFSLAADEITRLQEAAVRFAQAA